MEFDHSALKGRMREKDYSQHRLASKVGISEAALWNKLANKSEFTSKEMLAIMLVLGIKDPKPYFFTLKDGKTHQ